jgi:hypothetical protein
MLAIADLDRAIEAYRKGKLSLDQFEDWFEDASRTMFGESTEVREALLSIEFALSGHRFDGILEEGLKQELANAVRPLAPQRALTSILVWDVLKGSKTLATTAAAETGNNPLSNKRAWAGHGVITVSSANNSLIPNVPWTGIASANSSVPFELAAKG